MNKYKQLAARQGQPAISQPHRYQQHQHHHHHQQQQQQLRRPLVPGESSFKQCSHLKCCHDEKRRRANLLYLGTKFTHAAVRLPAEECLLHEPIPKKSLGILEPSSSRMLGNHRTTGANTDTKRFRISHLSDCSSDSLTLKSAEDNTISAAPESNCCSGNCDVPHLPALENKAKPEFATCVSQSEENKPVSQACNSQVKSDPRAIRIPCGRDGSFCEPDTPRHTNLVTLKLGDNLCSTRPVLSMDNQALPFRVWKRSQDKLGGAFYSSNLNNLHRA